MLLSYAPAFIFLHVDKAAGSSIQDALAQYAEPRRNSRPRRKLIWLGSLNHIAHLYRALEFPEHVTANTVRRCLPADLYSAAFKFAFVRNPYDRLVSRYEFLRSRAGHRDHRRVMRMKGFEQFIRWEIRRNRMSQHSYVTDAKGSLIVDFVGRYEQLHRDFASVCSRLGLVAQLSLIGLSGRPDYRTYYTPQTRALVGRCCAYDLELFGYDFDGPRTF
jgi:sulfotransferase famil protein